MSIDREQLEKDIVLALRQVYDPDISVNVYDLGLIYEIKVDDGNKVFITMTLTSPTCPMADSIIEDVHEAVSETPGVESVSIELVFEPQWEKSMMSEEAMLELGLM